MANGPIRMCSSSGSWLLRSAHTTPLSRLPPRMGSPDAVFKAYDIRGVVPDELDAGLARKIGAAFARFAKADRILVARDMRESGVELSKAFAEGVTSEGVDVV